MDANYVYVAAPASVVSALIGALIYHQVNKRKATRAAPPPK